MSIVLSPIMMVERGRTNQKQKKQNVSFAGQENNVVAQEKPFIKRHSVDLLLAGITAATGVGIYLGSRKNNFDPVKGLRIWRDLYLKLPNSRKLSRETIKKIRAEIGRCYKGNVNPIQTSPEKTNLLNISYEGAGHKAGGQTDIFIEIGGEFEKQNVNTFNVSPLFEFEKGNQKYGIVNENGKMFYRTPGVLKAGQKRPENESCFKSEIFSLGKFKLSEGKADNLEVFYNPDSKTFLLKDDKNFNFGKIEDNQNIYSNFGSTENYERSRVGQFNNLVYEFIHSCMRGDIKLPGKNDSSFIPNKMVSHEAWQSGGLLMKMRLLSIARAADKQHGNMSEQIAQSMKDLADNTVTPIHNIGESYQGRLYYKGEAGLNEKTMEQYFENIFGEYANDIVNAMMLDKKANAVLPDRLRRICFDRDIFNPAGASIVLGRCGTVSEGYFTEIKRGNNAGSLRALIENAGGVGALPNGVNKESLILSAENAKNLTTSLKNLTNNNAGTAKKSAMNLDNFKIEPTFDEKGILLPGDKFKEVIKANRKTFKDILKRTFDKNNKEATPLDFIRENAPHKENIDLSDITDSTKIYSIAARADMQKGTNTIMEGYKKAMEKWPQDKEKPIFILVFGGNNGKLIKELADFKKEMDTKGVGKRLIIVNKFITDDSLLNFINVGSSAGLPLSDFEPYGIAELKMMYKGTHVICTNTGGMKSEGKISRKMYSIPITDFKDNYTTIPDGCDLNKVNSISIGGDYEALTNPENSINGKLTSKGKELLNKYSDEFAKALIAESQLADDTLLKFDQNAAKIDTSWNKGAIQNYMDKLNIK